MDNKTLETSVVVVISENRGLGEMLHVSLDLAGFKPIVYDSIRDALALHRGPFETVVIADVTTIGDRDAARLRHAHPETLIVAGIPSHRDTRSWADIGVPLVEIGMVSELLISAGLGSNVIDLASVTRGRQSLGHSSHSSY